MDNAILSLRQEPEPAKLTVRRLVRRFLKAMRRRGIDPRSLERYEHYCLSFVRRYGSRPAADIRARHLVRWIMSHAEWKRNSTKENAARAVIACWKWACEVAELDVRPIVGLARQKTWGSPQPRKAIRPDEYAAMMRFAKGCTGGKGSRGPGRRRGRPSRSVFRRALYFLAQTGARPGEMRAAQWDFVDWQRGIILLQEHKTVGKTGRPRVIALSRRVLWLLRWMYRHRNAHRGAHAKEHAELIFRSTWGTAWTRQSFARLFRKYARLAGVREEVSSYSLRHGFTVTGLKNGVGERQLADLLGHAGTARIGWYGRDAGLDMDYLHQTIEDVHRRPS